MMPCIRFRLLAAATLLPAFVSAGPMAHAEGYPVTVENCDTKVTFDKAPSHAVTEDIGMAEMMVALGLKDRMAGVTGLGWYRSSMTDQQKQMLSGLPELADKEPSTEILLAAQTDFFFAGWNYGFHVGGALTPANLEKLGIKSYAIQESCAHIMKRPAVTIADTYMDLRNIGRIFNVGTKADELVAGMQHQVDAVTKALAVQANPMTPKVFVYDSGEDAPFTAGALAMPTALIKTAGGSNIMADVNASWTKVNWEKVVERNPDWVIIVDYDKPDAKGKIAWLKTTSPLKDSDAVRNDRFIILSYVEAVPSIHNGDAVQKIARTLHPDLALSN
jgi:iron complex transport system substrate-binding protein